MRTVASLVCTAEEEEHPIKNFAKSSLKMIFTKIEEEIFQIMCTQWKCKVICKESGKNGLLMSEKHYIRMTNKYIIHRTGATKKGLVRTFGRSAFDSIQNSYSGSLSSQGYNNNFLLPRKSIMNLLAPLVT